MRRNRLSDFRNVRASGLIAMKLDEGDRLIGVATCREGDDVMLSTRLGRCIRFQITDDTLRVFAGRESAGVRGVRLAESAGGRDEVNSLSVLRHVEASVGERAAFLRAVALKRRSNGLEEEAAEVAAEIEGSEPEEGAEEAHLSAERVAHLGEDLADAAAPAAPRAPPPRWAGRPGGGGAATT